MKYFILFLLGVFLLSCQNEISTHYCLTDISEKVVQPEASPLELNESEFSLATVCQDRYLVFHNRDRVDQCFAIYDLETLKPLGYTGVVGEGPGEIINGCAALPSREGFLVVDYSKYLIYYFNIKEAIADTKYLPETVGSIRDHKNFPGHISTLGDETYFGSNISVTSPSSYYASFVEGNLFTGETKKVLDPNPIVDLFKLSFNISSSSDRYVVAYSKYHLLSIYNRKGEVVREIYGEKALKKRKRRFYFGKPCCAGNDLFVDHHTGYSHIKDKRGRWKDVGSEEILHFDLDGNYIETIRLDHNVSTFIVLPSRKQLLVNLKDSDHPYVLVPYEPVGS
ncbi:TolB-like 6-bladed beta-propeller domain-containing protein [Halosquirtibacter laminarini]|uniref:TolB-like 6-bladed beta-propeller domain-containing protein n=1 Tax=Halosquirtibacter laminarini TaxID=3374600 RepID=A0AC61NMD2_9BACT|nr:TolB-like 6-bladed beta-propeller domain-containing protein [Prolixibacteraceae bacterium]